MPLSKAYERGGPSARKAGRFPIVIYDFGMNNGDDVEYYLLKAERVVAVEADRSLCELAERRFAREVAEGRVTILNVALAEQESDEPITFYLHKTEHARSQLPKPSNIEDFEAVQVPCRTPASIVSEFGEPLYIKIDVEFFDLTVLENLFAAGIFPNEISAESHSIGIFACLVANGYRSFNLVDGASIARRYGAATIQTLAGPRRFAFKVHTAGPFGEDIADPWEDANSFFYKLAGVGLGWKDIHASRQIPAAHLPSWRLVTRQTRDIGVRAVAGVTGRARERIRAALK